MDSKSDKSDTRSEIELIEEQLRDWVEHQSRSVKREKKIVAQYNLGKRNYYRELIDRELMDSAKTTQSTGESGRTACGLVPFDPEKSDFPEWFYMITEDDTYYDNEGKHGVAVTLAESKHTEAVKAIANGDFSYALLNLRLADGALDRAYQFKKSIMPYERAESIKAWEASQARLEKDPRQKAKKFVLDCWRVWQEEPERHKSKAEFARDMLKQEQCKSLKSQKKIEDWCREWEKSHPAG